MKKILLLISLLFFIPVSAQEYSREKLDSLYEKFIWLRNAIDTDLPDEPAAIDPSESKCGFGLVYQLISNFESFTPEQQSILKILLQRPIKDTSIVSPSGFFRIHYNIDSTGVPAYNNLLTVEENVMQVALALDSSFNFEVNFLGYPPPPQDNGAGGDNLYDVYITSLGNLYGYTQPEFFIGNDIASSYFVIDDDYQGFFSTGLDGMKVTVAHELHHAIQVGNYTLQRFDQDAYFYEITSTAMEEFVYNDVNDYYAYMRDYFDSPHRAFAKNNGYNLAIWNIFLRDKFGYDILKRQWELLPQMRALNAIVTSINEKGATFGSMLNEFGIWTFFTGYRTIPGKYFEEAAAYPRIKPLLTIVFNSQPVNVNESKPTSNNFITFINNPDTIVAIITNTDYANGISNPDGSFSFIYTLSSDSISGSTRLTDNYFAKLDADQHNNWAPAEILNNQVVRQGASIFPVISPDELFAYPNPFFYNKIYNNLCNCIEVLVDFQNEDEADLNIYTSAMELVFSKRLPIENNYFGRKALMWHIRSMNKKLASGVYIFAVRSGNKTTKGKLVIFNE